MSEIQYRLIKKSMFYSGLVKRNKLVAFRITRPVWLSQF